MVSTTTANAIITIVVNVVGTMVTPTGEDGSVYSSRPG
jgi:hypothetical protein